MLLHPLRDVVYTYLLLSSRVASAFRYICVCHSTLAKKLCTIKNVIRAIVVIYVIAILSQLTLFFDKYFHAVNVHVPASHGRGPNVTVVGCVKEYASFVTNNMHVYFTIYYLIRIIFIHLVSCSVVSVVDQCKPVTDRDVG